MRVKHTLYREFQVCKGGALTLCTLALCAVGVGSSTMSTRLSHVAPSAVPSSCLGSETGSISPISESRSRRNPRATLLTALPSALSKPELELASRDAC